MGEGECPTSGKSRIGVRSVKTLEIEGLTTGAIKRLGVGRLQRLKIERLGGGKGDSSKDLTFGGSGKGCSRDWR